MSPRAIGVIPSRWGSTRFPGKSLAPVGGKPLLAWVVERARQARRLAEILVATDDARIAAAAESFGVAVALTSPDHPSGTDRIAEAIRGRDADVVVNVQGDEPLIDPALIDRVAGTLLDAADWDMATAAAPIRTAEELHNSDVVKVVRARDGRALYFSRSVIPHVRGAAAGHPPAPGAHFRHIGLYGYRRAFLERLVREPPCALENLEKLEQLRALDLGCRMAVLECEAFGIGVDSPADVPKAEALLRRAGLL
jgi:3-deoxy-manno-octulosonate cytidylyltransferase (CMP-KDO synthetase)